MCKADADCPAVASADGGTGGSKCYAIPVGGGLSEFADQYVGFCIPWTGSRTTCTSNASCGSGESCSVYQDFTDMDLDVTIKGACQALPNPSGAAVGAACTAAAQCASGTCATNAITGRGYCSDVCVGGDADCGNGTSCRDIAIDARDPATTDDDLKVGLCTQTDIGARCSFDIGCRACSSDADCNTAQGVFCADDNICRDGLGRCADPCRTCTPGGPSNGGCPSRSTCTTDLNGAVEVAYCATATGCVRADLPQTLVYDHQRCGDVGTTDLCYYHSRRTLVGGNVDDVFMCGVACPPDGGACPSILLGDGGAMATACRNVYEFGIARDGGVVGGLAFPAQQCAPASAFVGRDLPAPDAGTTADAGSTADAGTDDGGAAADAGANTDGGTAADGGADADGGTAADGGADADGGTAADGGADGG
jgi:hypothetical protein